MDIYFALAPFETINPTPLLNPHPWLFRIYCNAATVAHANREAPPLPSGAFFPLLVSAVVSCERPNAQHYPLLCFLLAFLCTCAWPYCRPHPHSWHRTAR